MSGNGNISVLIVDDDPLSSTLASRLLGIEGWSVQVVSTYEEALKNVQENQPYNAILMDLYLSKHKLHEPIAEGIDLSAKIKEAYNRKTWQSPLIIGYTSQDEAKILRETKPHIDYILRKPIDADSFSTQITQYLKEHLLGK